MTQLEAPNSTDFLAENLRVLADFQPDVAKLVESADLPVGTERAVGRDGSETFRVSDESGTMRWLGATSMPTISAAELFGNIHADHGSVVMPGVLSGREPLLVAQRLAPFAAVFVIESSPAYLRLALTLCDYRDPIRNGRIVFVCGSDIVHAMVTFFASHPGYEYPGHVFHSPILSPQDAAVVRDAVERAGESVLGNHAGLLQDLQDRVAQNYADQLSDTPDWRSPRVGVFSVQGSQSSLSSVSQIGNALRQLGWEHQMCIPNSPERCHAAARLQVIAEQTPDLVLFVNSSPTRSRTLLPRSIPVVSWYLPGFLPAGLSAEHAGSFDLFVASTAQQEQLILDAGLSCLRVAPAADASIFVPPSGDPATSDARESLTVLADLPRDNAKDMNLTLTSQVALWNAIRDTARQCTNDLPAPSVADVLTTAESRSGTVLSDASLRRTFETLISQVAQPAARACAAVDALLASNADVRVYGTGWELVELPEGVYCGAIPAKSVLSQTFRRSRAVIFPICSDLAIQQALGALATGTTVVIEASRAQLANAHPLLEPVLEHLNTFASPVELARVVASARSDPNYDAAALVTSKHSFAARLREIVAKVESLYDAIGALS